MHGNRSRRRYLGVAGAAALAALAGCPALSGDGGDDSGGATSAGGGSTSRPGVGTTARGGADSGTRSGAALPARTAGDPVPPDADVVVAADGSGEYESLQAAHDETAADAVIRLAAGSYTLTPSGGGDVTLVGAGRAATTVTVDGDGMRVDLDGDLAVWGLRLRTAENVYVNTGGRVTANYARYAVPTEGTRTAARGVGGRVEAYKSVLDPPTVDKDSTVGSIPVWIGALAVRQCRVESVVRPGRVEATDTTFVPQVVLPGSSGEIRGSTLRNGVSFNAMGGTALTITDCDLHADGEGYAFRIPSANGAFGRPERPRYSGPAIENSTVRGRIGDHKVTVGLDRYDYVWKSLRRLSGNVFRAEGADLAYFVDGKGANVITRNAFVGADVRVDADAVTAHDETRDVGNYYSAYDRPDGDGDGIVDEPRQLPGDGSVTDEYPLASKDISQYPSR